MNNKEGLIYQAFTSFCELLFIKLCVVHTLKLVQNASYRAKFIKVKAREKKVHFKLALALFRFLSHRLGDHSL